jgi:hypothetical protein
MRVLAENLDNMTPGRGLHCVWEFARVGGQKRLVAHWINPGAEDVGSQDYADAIDGDQARGPRLRINLQFVWRWPLRVP